MGESEFEPSTLWFQSTCFSPLCNVIFPISKLYYFKIISKISRKVFYLASINPCDSQVRLRCYNTKWCVCVCVCLCVCARISHVVMFNCWWLHGPVGLVCLSMESSRQEYGSGLPFPSSGDLPNLGFKPGFPALQADSVPTEPPGKSTKWCGMNLSHPDRKPTLVENQGWPYSLLMRSQVLSSATPLLYR